MGIFDDLKEIKSDRSELKKFALTMAIFFAGIGLLALIFHGRHQVLWLGLAAPFVIFYFIKTEWLKPVHRGWMALALAMGFVMTRVILTILFFCVLTPFSIFARLFKKRFMDIEFRKPGESYWMHRDPEKEKNRNYEHQF